MKRLEGKVIALAGSRKIEETSKLIANLGGTPLHRPAQGNTFVDEAELEKDIRALVNGSYDWFIFTTGIGTDKMFQVAEKIGEYDKFLDAVSQANVAARGYKTVNLLKKLGITPVVRDDDGSVAGLLRLLPHHSFHNSRVAIQLHGDNAPTLNAFLEDQGAQVKEVLPYKHTPPETEVIEQLTREVIAGEVDAVSFTSTPQVRFLFRYAREKAVLDEVLAAFHQQVVALAVGKVTAAALKEEGVERVIVPEHERMGSAIIALEKYYES